MKGKKVFVKKRILVVDDNKMNSVMITDILESEGYEAFAIFSGVKIVETVLLIKPDAILLDIVMPDVDGFEVCRKLKKLEEAKNIPIIMITAMTDTNLLREAFELGAFDYIKKPFDKIEVVARLQSALRYSEQQKKLESLAMRDGLTNLYNHRMVMEFLKKEMVKAVRNQQNIAFIMLDIDYFKKVNDTYGHKTGDFVIMKIAELIQNSVREGDIVGRYGGEEFCVTMVGLSLEEVMHLAERIRKTIENHVFDDGINKINITASIGISFREPKSDINENQLIKISDSKLYEAKANGRNRIEYEILS